MNIDQFYLDRIQQEQDALKKVFNTYFSHNDIQNPKILDICCGCVNEEPVLFEYFGDKINLISVDSDPQFKEITETLGRKSFRTGNIFNLGKLVTHNFDLVVGRNVPLNPNHREYFEAYNDPWPAFFSTLPKYMNPSSQLFLTVCRDDEFYRALEILQSNDYELLLKEENRIIVPSDRLGVAGSDIKDNYVVLARFPKLLKKD